MAKVRDRAATRAGTRAMARSRAATRPWQWLGLGPEQQLGMELGQWPGPGQLLD